MKKILFTILLFAFFLTTGQAAVDECSCVFYVRKMAIPQPPKVEWAYQLQVNQTYPVPDSWVVFKNEGIYKGGGHASWVVAVATSTFLVFDWNYLGKCQFSKRIIRFDDFLIKGYYW